MKGNQGKPGSNNPMQKGERRQRLHEHQDNHGSPQKQESTFQNNKENKFQ